MRPLLCDHIVVKIRDVVARKGPNLLADKVLYSELLTASLNEHIKKIKNLKNF